MANKPQVNLKFIKGYGDNFKKLREMKGLTQKQLYDEIHISDKSISLIEKEQREPTIEQINIYSEYFNVSLDYLTGRTKITNPTIQTISELIGLSEEAINVISELNKKRNIRAYIDLLSMIIEHPNFEYLLGLIEGFLTSGNEVVDSSVHIISSLKIKKGTVALTGINETIKNILNDISQTYRDKTVPTEILLLYNLYNNNRISQQELTAEIKAFEQRFIDNSRGADNG